MIVALYILIAIVAVGAVCYIVELRHRRLGPRREETEPSPQPNENEQCCGMHITCDKDSLLAAMSDRIEYYDDEELDRFRGRGAEDYADEEIEEFRDVLLTLIPTDIAGWARSVQLRGIELPAEVREELLMMVREERARKIG